MTGYACVIAKPAAARTGRRPTIVVNVDVSTARDDRRSTDTVAAASGRARRWHAIAARRSINAGNTSAAGRRGGLDAGHGRVSESGVAYAVVVHVPPRQRVGRWRQRRRRWRRRLRRHRPTSGQRRRGAVVGRASDSAISDQCRTRRRRRPVNRVVVTTFGVATVTRLRSDVRWIGNVIRRRRNDVEQEHITAKCRRFVTMSRLGTSGSHLHYQPTRSHQLIAISHTTQETLVTPRHKSTTRSETGQFRSVSTNLLAVRDRHFYRATPYAKQSAYMMWKFCPSLRLSQNALLPPVMTIACHRHYYKTTCTGPRKVK